MPYAAIGDLPSSVQAHLPPDAQALFLRAFNGAWRTYAAQPNREELAFRTAWSVVRKRYRKLGDCWVERADA